MDAGTLDRRVRIERRSGARNPHYGGPTEDWVEVATVWANVQEVLPSRGESQAQGIAIAARPARVRMRYRDDITSAMRLVYLDRGGRLMKILTPPVEIGRRDGLELMVSDFTTAGNAE